MPIVADEIIRKYLLNALPEAERERFEEQYFEHDEIYQWMQFLEEELISDYVYGRLTPSERRSFESHHLATPERRRRIEMAKRWKRVIAASGPRKLTLRLTLRLKDRFRSLARLFSLRTVLVAATAIMFIGSAAVVWNYLNARQQKDLSAGIQMASAGAKPPEHGDGPERGPERYATVQLTPATGLPRAPADETHSLVIPQGFSGAVFTLLLHHEEHLHVFKARAAELYRGEPAGAPVWEAEIDGAGLDGQPLRVKVPKTAFEESGLYTLLLTREPAKERRLPNSLAIIYRISVTLE